MGFTSQLLVSFLVVGALLPVPTVTLSKVKPRPLSLNRCLDYYALDASRSERAVASCVGPYCRPCDGICKSRCGVGETASPGYCGRGCRCCKRAIITPTCPSGGSCGSGGKCTSGTTYTCPRGHTRISGYCGASKSCTCCSPSTGTCPSPFAQIGSEYLYFHDSSKKNWDDALSHCKSIGGSLAEPADMEGFIRLIESLYSHMKSDIWLGATDRSIEQDWKWLSGGSVPNYLWPSRPVWPWNQPDGDGDCMQIHYHGYSGFFLNAYYCRVKGYFVCECTSQNTTANTCLPGASCGKGGKCSGGTTCPKGHKSIPGICGSIRGCTCCAPSDCFYQGKTYTNGATWTDKCNIHKCSSGSVTTSLRSDCCSFGGSSYLPGAKIKNSCAQLMCAKGKFQYKGIEAECPRCKAYLDPHIVTYDQRYSSYSYQGCGNYSLSQIGSTYQPTVAIYATFATCGGRSYVTCVETVTIKNDEHTFITIRFESNELKVEINGNDYAVSSSSPSIVMNAAYPVLVWKSAANCVILQGSSGFLVQFCGSSRANQVYVWASPAITKSLKGLCGTVNNNINDDFTTRGGIITSHWQRTPSDAFPTSWLTSSTSNGKCVGQRKREAQNKCDSNSSSLNKYKSQCRTTIMNGFTTAQSGELNAMIEDCVFDLCHVNDPDDWIKAVEETAQVQADIKADTLVPGCQGRCTAGGGSGYCKDMCSLGEELLGSCPGGNCFCCRQQN